MERFFRLFSIALVLILLSGCIHFKIQTKNHPSEDDLRWAEFNGKTFVIHSGSNAYYFDPVSMTEDTLTGILQNLTARHTVLVKKPKGGQYSPKDKYILDEVHLYLNNVSVVPEEGSTLKIPVSNIRKLDSYTKDTGKDALVIITSIAAVPVTLFGIVAIAWLIDPPSSCPYVYVMDESGSYQLIGEVFGGAVYTPLERHDFMTLPDVISSSGKYVIRISNELSEVQHINMAKMIAVRHTPGCTIVPHRSGRLFTITKPVAPVKAISSGNADLLPALAKPDGECFMFDEHPEITGDSSAFNSVILTFAVPADADTGKLVIRAGNLMWGDYQINQFTKLFGRKYDNWIRKQRRSDGSAALKWQRDQKLFMDLCVETDTGWKYIDYFELTGPEGRRDLVMPVATDFKSKQTSGSHEIRLRLTTGFMFWEIDYAAMDFSKDDPFTTEDIQPLSAVTESGADVAARISEDDSHYYIQTEPGKESIITYLVTDAKPGLATTYILHTKGYYEHVRNYRNPADRSTLLLYTKPGKLSRVSSDNYKEFRKSGRSLVSKNLIEKP